LVQIMNEARIAGQQSVRRAIDVLFCFDAATPALSAVEVAGRLGMNRTTAYRYLQTLVGTGRARDLGEGRFGLGARTVSLAEAYTSQWGELEAVAGAALVRLRDAVGETAALHVRQGASRVVVRQVESHHELHRTYRELGQPISLLTGAPSLAILAALPDSERAAYVEGHADESRRPHVIRALADAVEDGYASTHGSRVPGVASVAAAVRDPAGLVVAAVNVTGPEDRLPPSRTAEVARHVTAAATWVEGRLAGRENTIDPRPHPQPRSEP
jgi:DNA-binding IclR family transcriptional regulator